VVIRLFGFCDYDLLFMLFVVWLMGRWLVMMMRL